MFVAPRHVSPYRDSADDMHCKFTIYFLDNNSFTIIRLNKRNLLFSCFSCLKRIKKRTLGEQLLIKGAS